MSKQVIQFQPDEQSSFVNTNQYLLTKHPKDIQEDKYWSPGSLLEELFQLVDKEDRLVQQQRNPDDKKSVFNIAENITLRHVDAAFSIPGDNGNLLKLSRVARNPPYIANDIIPDDGYVIISTSEKRELRSEQETQFDAFNKNNMKLNDSRPSIKTNCQRFMYPVSNQTVAQACGSKQIRQLNATNKQQLPTKRPIHRNFTDFGSKFMGHPEWYDKLSGTTTYSKSFQLLTDVKDVLHSVRPKPRVAGCREREVLTTSITMTSVVTGEKFRDHDNNIKLLALYPRENQQIQRAQLPISDPTINKRDLKNYKAAIKQFQPYDIARSFTLADKLQTLHPKYDNPGQFRHII